MGHRTVKRVPLDFSAPLHEVWSGYVMPDHLRLPTCRDCDGEGYGPEARAIAGTFYPHMIGGAHPEALAWSDKLGQAEVDNLVDTYRTHWKRPDGSNPTAAEVNASQRTRGLARYSHDAINRGILVEFRCQVLGIPWLCARCEGHGTEGTSEQRAAEDNWEGTEPPTGLGWQLWETVSEGSPVSPVFETAEALADWCEGNATWFGSMRWTREKWLSTFREGTTDADSLLVVRR